MFCFISFDRLNLSNHRKIIAQAGDVAKYNKSQLLKQVLYITINIY